jgi:hypothetical protein
LDISTQRSFTSVEGKFAVKAAVSTECMEMLRFIPLLTGYVDIPKSAAATCILFKEGNRLCNVISIAA